MRQGVLIYDHDTDRMDIRFDLDDYYGGLHCGTSMEVFVNLETLCLDMSSRSCL